MVIEQRTDRNEVGFPMSCSKLLLPMVRSEVVAEQEGNNRLPDREPLRPTSEDAQDMIFFMS
jgi:hypothetical protein